MAYTIMNAPKILGMFKSAFGDAAAFETRNTLMHLLGPTDLVSLRIAVGFRLSEKEKTRHLDIFRLILKDGYTREDLLRVVNEVTLIGLHSTLDEFRMADMVEDRSA